MRTLAEVKENLTVIDSGFEDDEYYCEYRLGEYRHLFARNPEQLVIYLWEYNLIKGYKEVIGGIQVLFNKTDSQSLSQFMASFDWKELLVLHEWAQLKEELAYRGFNHSAKPYTEPMSAHDFKNTNI